MANNGIKVFISSTWMDLKEERAVVAETIKECGCEALGMEQFIPNSKPQWDTIKKYINESDCILLLIQERYGSICCIKGLDWDLSYTEMEFRYAVEQNKPILAFIHDDKKDHIHRNSKKVQKDYVEKLTLFKKNVEDNWLRGTWTTSKSLKTKTKKALNQFIRENMAGGHNDLKGVWEIRHTYNDVKFLDIIEISSQDSTDKITGTATRKQPITDEGKTWTFIGNKYGENLICTYYSTRDPNITGCSFLRFKNDNEYEGKYIRYNRDFDVPKIEDLDLTMTRSTSSTDTKRNRKKIKNKRPKGKNAANPNKRKSRSRGQK